MHLIILASNKVKWQRDMLSLAECDSQTDVQVIYGEKSVFPFFLDLVVLDEHNGFAFCLLDDAIPGDVLQQMTVEVRPGD